MMEHIYLERDGEGGQIMKKKKKCCPSGLKCWGERGKEAKGRRKKNEG